MEYLFKIWSYKYRIFMWLMVLSGAFAELGRTQSYWQAIWNGFGIYCVMWLGAMAYYEHDIAKAEKEMDEYRKNLERFETK